MAPTDKELDGISLRDAYSAIRIWYQAHIDEPLKNGDVYRKNSAPLVRALPATSEMSDIEIVAVFAEVIAGRLEWAYEKCGDKMAAYAKAALETKGRSYSLTPEETKELQTSDLWRFLKR